MAKKTAEDNSFTENPLAKSVGQVQGEKVILVHQRLPTLRTMLPAYEIVKRRNHMDLMSTLNQMEVHKLPALLRT